MKKSGFVLIETIIVLVVVVVCMLGLYKSYSFLFNNLKQNKYYDNINDIYKINSVKKLFLTGFPSDDYIKITTSNCASYMSSDCTQIYALLGIDTVFYTGVNIDVVLTSASDLSNTDKNYMKFLENGHKYLIIHYVKNTFDYYSSLAIGGTEWKEMDLL